jgi:glycosyltransferase involved in cell wall biosynthesis
LLLINTKLENNFIIFGNTDEIKILLENVKKLKLDNIASFQVYSLIEKDKFLYLLSQRKWLISTYPLEGFGLTVYEAMYYGLIILVSKSGSMLEIVPEINFYISRILHENKFNNIEALLVDASSLNRDQAIRLMERN